MKVQKHLLGTQKVTNREKNYGRQKVHLDLRDEKMMMKCFGENHHVENRNNGTLIAVYIFQLVIYIQTRNIKRINEITMA